MRPHLILFLVLLATISLLIVPWPGRTQPECVEIWFQLDQQVDPPCVEPSPGWSILVTSSPTSASGTCSGQSISNTYTGVQFFTSCTSSTVERTCTIFATGSLSGKYEILEVSGICFKVCQLCP